MLRVARASCLIAFATLLALPAMGQQTDTSSERSGFSWCMGSNYRCQVLRAEDMSIPLGRTVYFNGGAISGNPSLEGWRCGTSTTHRDYIEVYVNDSDFTWPTYCVHRTTGSLYLSTANRYDFRGTSIGGSNASTFTFSLHTQSLSTPTFFDGSRSGDGNVYLIWNDNSWGETGNKVERRRGNRYDDPRPTYTYSVMGVYAPYYTSSLRSQLNPSATRFCIDEGYSTYASYDISGPLSSVHSWWNGSSWSTSGNNSVFYVENLRCTDSWVQIGTTGANGYEFTDGTSDFDEYNDYRVRAYRGSSHSGYSSIHTVPPGIPVCCSN